MYVTKFVMNPFGIMRMKNFDKAADNRVEMF